MPEKVSAGQGWQEAEPAAGAKVPGLQGKHSEVKATPGSGRGLRERGMGGLCDRPAPRSCSHAPVMPMFLTSTGLGTLDHTEKAVVRQYRTLFPRLSSTWDTDPAALGGFGTRGGGPAAEEGTGTATCHHPPPPPQPRGASSWHGRDKRHRGASPGVTWQGTLTLWNSQPFSVVRIQRDSSTAGWH